MTDCAKIEIDCERSVVSVSIENENSSSRLDGTMALQTSKSMLIAECLRPQIVELMNCSKPELERRSLIAMGITPR